MVKVLRLHSLTIKQRKNFKKMAESKGKQQNKSKDTISPGIKTDIQELIDKEEHALRKRLPVKLPKRKNDIYVHRKTDFKAQMLRCQKLLDTGYNMIFIHGIGMAVNRAINLAMQLNELEHGTLEMEVNTSTVELSSDLEANVDDLDPDSRGGINSAVHIRLFRLKKTESSQKQATQ
ncbi:ribonuclease P protein subunit p20-like isoform X1 [Lingula anatina]|uniref:Ribonuclease P protein subunit p20 n=2 Tax=Lingula anatina TaxID=7574 RepID=A0A1S3IJ91_LINAN|nr:ribonuclease P protein subunit p20-like isoform X1 [Lingula anatina]|eukprot:XP_013398282.1 ribonuclease P protein subunit p20-like isoform X1 [Lingula anatina]